VTDEKFEKLMQFPFGGKGQGFLVERWLLRNMLMHGLGEGEAQGVKIVWGKKFDRYEEDEDKVVAYFEDGTKVEGDVLVGADGARSRVREQRTKLIAYEPLPVANIGACIQKPPLPTLEKLQGAISTSLIRALGTDGVSLLAMPFTDQDKVEYIVWALTFPSKVDVPADANIKEYLADKAAKVNQEAIDLLNLTPAENFLPHRMMRTCRLVKDKPLGKTTRVTLLGDSAHAMTSHAGLGGNMAFLDAIDLAAALSTPKWHAALHKYEETMIKRGYEAVAASLANTNRMTSPAVLGSNFRNWSMWIIGRFIGGETKIDT